MPSGVNSSTRFEMAARKCRSCETNSMVPSYCDSAVISISLVAMSGGWSAPAGPRKSAGRTRFFAARQHPASLLYIVAGEPEAAGQRAQRTLPGLREGILQRLKHGALAVE